MLESLIRRAPHSVSLFLFCALTGSLTSPIPSLRVGRRAGAVQGKLRGRARSQCRGTATVRPKQDGTEH